jgi:hypothetical protein
LSRQNDAALGRVLDIISPQCRWKDSLVLVVETTRRTGPDHVDATRTIAFAAGPYVKRGTSGERPVRSLSMLRTIELVLGLKSLNAAGTISRAHVSEFSPISLTLRHS